MTDTSSRSASPAASTSKNSAEIENLNPKVHADESDGDRAGGSPKSKEKGKGKQEAEEEGETPSSDQPAESAWQAIWSPQHNAYYFFNSVTQETTWVNPLQTEASLSTEPEGEPEPSPLTAEAQPSGPSGSTSAAMSQYAAMQSAAIAQGIDPSLAHLDPSLASSVPGAAASIPSAMFSAKFNARTGAFAKQDARDPTHLSEFERAKRMSEFYFDVGAWESDVAQRKEEEAAEEENGGRKRKRPTKKDLERFKEQKKQKKIAKTAWLRT